MDCLHYTRALGHCRFSFPLQASVTKFLCGNEAKKDRIPHRTNDKEHDIAWWYTLKRHSSMWRFKFITNNILIADFNRSFVWKEFSVPSMILLRRATIQALCLNVHARPPTIGYLDLCTVLKLIKFSIMYAKCVIYLGSKRKEQRIPSRGGNSQGYLGVSMFMHVFLTIDITMYLNVNRLTKYSAYLCDCAQARWYCCMLRLCLYILQSTMLNSMETYETRDVQKSRC